MKKTTTRRRARQAGITLIEMLVVVTIIALFAALVGINIFRRADDAKVAAAKTQIDDIASDIGAKIVEIKNALSKVKLASQAVEEIATSAASPRWRRR